MQAASQSDAAFQKIPIIDVTNAGHPDPAIRQQLAKQVRDACINVGFFYVKGHGIPEEDIAGAVEVGKKFFELPTEQKSEFDSRKSSNFKGYTALLSENNDPNGRGDLHEGFDFGPEGDDGNEKTEKNAMSGANVWPTRYVPEFRESVLRYYQEAIRLGRSLFPLFALALDLPENYFEDKTKEAAAIMRVLHYPPQTGPHDDRVVGIGAHTDFECFTILWQQTGVQALQVLNTDKEWINATPIEGTLVINLGDQFARWTNDIFKSTVHRAINRTGVERYSMPLFFGTDYNVKLEAIPSCVSPERPAKYEVVTAGEYVRARLQAAYGH